MTCRVTVNDGVNPPVVIEDVLEQNVRYEIIQGGGSIVRFLDGSSATEQYWSKEAITISGRGKVPQGLRGLSYAGTLTVTIEAGVLGPDVYTCRSRGPSEDWGLTAAEVTWELRVEEA